MSILIRNGNTKWEKAAKAKFAEETQLQKLLYDSPALVEWQDDKPVVFTRESSLPGSGYTDLIGVAANGDILLVETKLAKNPEIRRKVIGQILEYAAFLWGTDYDEFSNMFAKREGKSLCDLFAANCADFQADEFQSAVTRNLNDGRFSLLIAVDEMNDELEKVLAYLSSRGGGLKLEALAVRVFTSGETSVLVPQRYGQLNQPPVSPPSKTRTVEEIISRSQDPHTRELMELIVSDWAALGHSIDPGTSSLSCRANINGSVEALFWADPNPSFGISPLFRSVEQRGAPAESVNKYRRSLAELPGFAGKRCLEVPRPPAPFSGLSDAIVKQFLQLTDELIREWRSAGAS